MKSSEFEMFEVVEMFWVFEDLAWTNTPHTPKTFKIFVISKIPQTNQIHNLVLEIFGVLTGR